MSEKILYVENIPANCNGGDYPCFAVLQDGKVVQAGRFCACRNGCSNTTPISNVEYDVVGHDLSNKEISDYCHYGTNKKWYFSYGTASIYPYCNGYTEVYADTKQHACDAFRLKHPDVYDNCLNCSFVYSQEEWDKIEADVIGECHETLDYSAVKYILSNKNKQSCSPNFELDDNF